MKKLLPVLLLPALLAGGCATDPSNIKADTSVARSCSAADRTRLAELTKEQHAMARNDAVGVFFVGLPLGSMGRQDYAAEIARLKGACGVA